MTLNAYITFGTSGLRVSPFALGTMTFGEDWGWGSSVADAEAILARYLDLGGNFIDHPPECRGGKRKSRRCNTKIAYRERL